MNVAREVDSMCAPVYVLVCICMCVHTCAHMYLLGSCDRIRVLSVPSLLSHAHFLRHCQKLVMFFFMFMCVDCFMFENSSVRWCLLSEPSTTANTLYHNKI